MVMKEHVTQGNSESHWCVFNSCVETIELFVSEESERWDVHCWFDLHMELIILYVVHLEWYIRLFHSRHKGQYKLFYLFVPNWLMKMKGNLFFTDSSHYRRLPCM